MSSSHVIPMPSTTPDAAQLMTLLFTYNQWRIGARWAPAKDSRANSSRAHWVPAFLRARYARAHLWRGMGLARALRWPLADGPAGGNGVFRLGCGTHAPGRNRTARFCNTSRDFARPISIS